MEQALETPEKLTLKQEQEKTLNTSRRPYGFLAKLLFWSMDLFYGKQRDLLKFKVLEVIARVPYQSWEHVGYIAMTHTYGKPDFARRIFDFVRESRHQQDNEQWHLFIIEEMTQAQQLRESFFFHRFVPQLIAFFYYHVSWLLYVMQPAWSYGLNADFEDHAEHEYMLYVQENPELETTPFASQFEQDYGAFQSQADLFRQIGLDERQHKLESEARIESARFT